MCNMKKSIIDDLIKSQIDQYGKKHIVRRYSTMLGELTRTVYELEDKERVSVLTDIEEILRYIIIGIKEQ